MLAFALFVRIIGVSCRRVVVIFLVLIAFEDEVGTLNDMTTRIDQSPTNFTTFVGFKANFHCTSRGGLVFWFSDDNVDIHLLPELNDHNVSFESIARSDGINGDNSTLCIVATEITNNTFYRCGVLDITTNLIVNFSAPAILAVQGKPLPPSGLLVYLERDEIIIGLEWNRSLTLFNDKPGPTLYYIIYGYFNDSTISSDQFEYFYKNETTLLTHKIFINYIGVKLCGLSTAVFSVSAKFEEVGEGKTADPEKIVNLPESSSVLCNYDPNSPHADLPSISVILGIALGFSILIFFSFVIFIYLIGIKHRYHGSTIVAKVDMKSAKKSTQPKVKESTDSESASKEKANTCETNSSCAYESVDELSSKDRSVKIISNCVYETATSSTGDNIVKMNSNYAYETAKKANSRADTVKMNPNCAYGTASKVHEPTETIPLELNTAYDSIRNNVCNSIV